MVFQSLVTFKNIIDVMIILVNVDAMSNKPPNRIRLRGRDRRRIASIMRNRNAQRYPDWHWHIGLTFNNHIGLDLLETASERDARDIAIWIGARGYLPVGIFRTENAWWVISSKEITPQLFQDFYSGFVESHGYNLSPELFEKVDLTHAYLSAKYGKTTFRISSKTDGQISAKLIDTIQDVPLRLNASD